MDLELSKEEKLRIIKEESKDDLIGGTSKKAIKLQKQYGIYIYQRK